MLSSYERQHLEEQLVRVCGWTTKKLLKANEEVESSFSELVTIGVVFLVSAEGPKEVLCGGKPSGKLSTPAVTTTLEQERVIML